jgi:hypothetical protein
MRLTVLEKGWTQIQLIVMPHCKYSYKYRRHAVMAERKSMLSFPGARILLPYSMSDLAIGLAYDQLKGELF